MAHKPPDIPLLALISDPDVDDKAIKTSYIMLQDPTDKRLCVSRSLVYYLLLDSYVEDSFVAEKETCR